jgi:Ni,Fe-hydrogenase I large subunit
LRNLIFAANYIQSHILHFYHLAALDYVDITAILNYKGNDPGLKKVKAWAEAEAGRLQNNVPGALGPFMPRYKGDYIPYDDINIGAIANYLQALKMRRMAHEMVAIFGGKMPHVITVMPGGVTEKITVEKIASYLWRLRELQSFIDNVYIPDVITVAKAYSQYFGIGKGYGNLLAYGFMPLNAEGSKKLIPGGVYTDGQVSSLDQKKIAEYVKFSRYNSGSGLHPSEGETEPDAFKSGAYSWVKAPRYEDKPHEVGPLARIGVAYLTKSNQQVVDMVNSTLKLFDADASVLFSTLGRHAARALECKLVADTALGWLLQLDPKKPVHTPYEVPKDAEGMGMTEAPRGALGHWIKIEGRKIARYQCVVPSTWNCCPRDDMGQRGPLEESLVGTPIANPDYPIEAVRVVRSFDPCLACAIHVVTPKGDVKKFRIS